MKKLISMLAVAGVAGAVSAQDVTFHFDLDGDLNTAENVLVNVGETVSWTVYASFTGYDDPTAYFGGFVGSFDATDPAAGTVSNIAVLMPNQGTTPAAAGASVENINIFQSALLGTDNQDNPLAIMSFDTTVDNANGWNYTADGVASVFADDGIFTLPDEFTAVSIVSDAIIIPAPGALALVGLGGLAAARRRR